MTKRKLLACAAIAAIWIMVVFMNIAAADARLEKANPDTPVDRYAVQTGTTSYVSLHSPDYPDIVLEQDGTDR
ncbi:MAG: hypothetical protein PUG02_01570 [Selenomonadaceae bacterium]|nr:hypothetical protein [Selenomonadaceae bacterium]